MLITFEGVDYCGKSTQVQLLAERLQASSRNVRVLREPGGTALGEVIRTLLLDRANTAMTDASELLLFSASRSQLVQEVVRPTLQSGTVVILDRYYDSTTAYQGYGRGIPLDVIHAVNRFATGGLVPTLTFVLDIPEEEIRRRMTKAGAARDRMESNGVRFFERVRGGYRELAETEPRFHILDGTQPIGILQELIWQTVKQKLE